ncbi:MAG: hypothetical protein RDU25_01940 [Patescibacteria group bacterium]|nr:hypothetical protein [Patescibacteria group bacterium]
MFFSLVVWKGKGMPSPQRVILGSSHDRSPKFIKRRFNQSELQPQVVIKPIVIPRIRIPKTSVIREVAEAYSRGGNFRERRKRRVELYGENRLTNFFKFYGIIARILRRYNGRDAIKVDIELHLKEYVQSKADLFRKITRKCLEDEAKRFINSREDMLLEMVKEYEPAIVARPLSPKDSRERGGEAYTEAAAKRRQTARRIDRITIRARLPGSTVDLFVTLGPATKRIDGRRVPCERRVFSIQTASEWEAWKRTRVKDKQPYRNNRPKGRRHDLN